MDQNQKDAALGRGALIVVVVKSLLKSDLEPIVCRGAVFVCEADYSERFSMWLEQYQS